MFNKFTNLFSMKNSNNVQIQSGGNTIISGRNIQINSKNGKRQVIIDGQDVSDVVNGFEIKIQGNVEGSVESVASDIYVGEYVKGDIDTTSGNVMVSQNVDGDIDTTSGDINIEGDMSGNIETVSGSVQANSIKANKIETVSGSVRV